MGRRLPEPLTARSNSRGKTGVIVHSPSFLSPGYSPGGAILVSVTLEPRESFSIRHTSLELLLKVTHFSRTTLDGYREHTSEDVWQTIELCRHTKSQPGVPLTWSVELYIPEDPSFESRPARVHWMARARFRPEGYREFSAPKGLHDATPPDRKPPVVDGRGFLPY